MSAADRLLGPPGDMAGGADQAPSKEIEEHDRAECAGRWLLSGLLDVHAPDVVITLNATAAFRDVPSRLPFLVAPETITFSAFGIDAVDGSVGATITLNGEPYTPGAVVTHPGLYIVQATATDSHGNLTEETTAFEIRDRETYDTAVVVEDLQEYYSPSGELEHVVITVLIASHGFDEKDLHLATLQASLLDESGSVVTFNTKPNGIAFSRQGDGRFVYDPLAVDIEIERGYMRVPFSIDLTGIGLAGLPPDLMVSGSSSSTRAVVPFEFMEVVSMVKSDDPESELEDLDLLNPSADGGLPNSDPDSDCRWRLEVRGDMPVFCSHQDPNTDECQYIYYIRKQEARSDAHGYPGKPEAGGRAVDHCIGDALSSCLGSNGASWLMWLESSEPGNRCGFEMEASPRFTGEVSTIRSAEGTVQAYISVELAGSVMTSVNGTVSAPASSSSIKSHAMESFYGQQVDGWWNVWNYSCITTIRVDHTAFVEVIADGLLYEASVIAQIHQAEVNLRVTGAVYEGPCAGLQKTLDYP